MSYGYNCLPKNISAKGQLQEAVFVVYERIIDVVETANNTGRLEDGMIIMKLLQLILLILEQGIIPVRRVARA